MIASQHTKRIDGSYKCTALITPSQLHQKLTCRRPPVHRMIRAAYASPAVRESELTALVIGSGFAGLSAAAGLSKRFKQVTLLERDAVPFDTVLGHAHASDSVSGQEQFEVGAKQRQGVSQYQQPHMMLKKGLSLLEELFPDYCAKLHEAGAVETDYLKDIIVYDYDKEFSTTESSNLHGLAASRHLLESVLRNCVLAVNNIDVQTGAAVKGVMYDAQNQRLTGVKLKSGEHREADLIIDASGSSSKMPEWLSQLGHPEAPVLTVDAGLRYTYRMYEMNHDPDRQWTMAICTNTEPRKIGILVPVEGNKWQVNMSGYKGNYCPTDEQGFLDFARSLPCNKIYEALRQAKPLTPITTFSKTRNFRRLFDKGQGMTVGIMGSQLLCETIDKQLAGAGPDRQQQLAALDCLPAAFHKELSSMVDYPWIVATGPDSQQPGAVVNMPEESKEAAPQWLGMYINTLRAASFTDAYLMSKMAAVFHMLSPPSSLFKPDVVLRLAWCWLANKAEHLQHKVQGNTEAKLGTGSEA